MSETLLEIPRNQNIEECEGPLPIRPKPGEYVSFFESGFGDQWAVFIDRRTGAGILRGSELGWDEGVPLIDGMPDDMMLGDEEMMWLRACWQSVRLGLVGSSKACDA